MLRPFLQGVLLGVAVDQITDSVVQYVVVFLAFVFVLALQDGGK